MFALSSLIQPIRILGFKSSLLSSKIECALHLAMHTHFFLFIFLLCCGENAKLISFPNSS